MRNSKKIISALIIIFVIIMIIIVSNKILKSKNKNISSLEPTAKVEDMSASSVPIAKVDSSTETSPQIKSEYHINENYNVVPNDINGNKKVILITIDDGPTKQAIGMMDTLNKHNAKAIFFINGIHNSGAPGVLQKEKEEGFSIGNHTWDHLNLKKEKKESVINDEINKNTKLITDLTGSAPRFFRPPYGASTPYVRNLVKQEGMIFMNWSGAALDWEKNTHIESVFLKNVLSTVHPGEILLIHEHLWTANDLNAMLTQLEQKGYTFLNPDQITS
ncbi:MAG: polysaccharide deacetylase family protein [Patescibacteria group bacterium]|nr:polysaccharide deacetylase family protein [Patescibacteria group bacterium]